MSYKVAVHHFTAKNSKMLVKRKMPSLPQSEEPKLIQQHPEKKELPAQLSQSELPEERKEYMEEIKELNADILKKSNSDFDAIKHNGRRPDSVRSPNVSKKFVIEEENASPVANNSRKHASSEERRKKLLNEKNSNPPLSHRSNQSRQSHRSRKSRQSRLSRKRSDEDSNENSFNSKPSKHALSVLSGNKAIEEPKEDIQNRSKHVVQNLLIDGGVLSNQHSVVNVGSGRQSEMSMSEREVYRQVRNNPQMRQSQKSLSSFNKSSEVSSD